MPICLTVHSAWNSSTASTDPDTTSADEFGSAWQSHGAEKSSNAQCLDFVQAPVPKESPQSNTSNTDHYSYGATEKYTTNGLGARLNQLKETMEEANCDPDFVGRREEFDTSIAETTSGRKSRAEQFEVDHNRLIKECRTNSQAYRGQAADLIAQFLGVTDAPTKHRIAREFKDCRPETAGIVTKRVLEAKGVKAPAGLWISEMRTTNRLQDSRPTSQ